MKRALVTTLVFSLFAFPLLAQSEESTNFRCVSLEHVRGEWRMEIKCEQGVGTISLADVGARSVYRGEGVFSSWSQQKMAALYESLVPQDNAPAVELLQLG
jgi:hypothetical protein